MLQIADDLVALHSTDPVTVVLSVLVRMVHPSIEAVEDVMYEQRALIRHHAMRRTLWLATPQTVRQMHAAATRKLVGARSAPNDQDAGRAGVAEPEQWLDDARAQILADLRDARAEHRTRDRAAGSRGAAAVAAGRRASRTPVRARTAG